MRGLARKIQRVWSKLNKTFIFLFVIVVVLVTTFFVCNHEKVPSFTITSDVKVINDKEIIYPVFKEKKINTIVDDYLSKMDLNSNFKYKVKEFDNGVTYLLFNNIFDTYNTYESYFFTASFEETSIESLFLEDKRDEFTNIVLSNLKKKYPEFVAECVISSDQKYELFDNELNIYFNGYTCSPTITQDVFVNINYNELKDILAVSVSYDNEINNKNDYQLDKNKKTVALTFDDGPSKYTKELIKILNNNHATATFFINGYWFDSYKDNLLYLANSNMEVGNHTFSHKNLTKISLSDATTQVTRNINTYKELTNKDMVLIRPPYGSYNSSLLKALDYPVISWSIDTMDWYYLNKDKVIERLIDTISDGSIILMHERYLSSIEAVKEVLPILYSMDYQVVSVSELFNLKELPLENGKLYRNVK